MSRTISWPAFIKYAGENELTYITDRLEWETDTDLSASDFEQGDLLIDSSGQAFALNNLNTGLIEANPKNEKFSCADISDLIKNHFSSIGECCVSKLNPGSIEECMRMLGQGEES